MHLIIGENLRKLIKSYRLHNSYGILYKLSETERQYIIALHMVCLVFTEF